MSNPFKSGWSAWSQKVGQQAREKEEERQQVVEDAIEKAFKNVDIGKEGNNNLRVGKGPESSG